MSFKEFHIKPVCCRMASTTWYYPGGEKSENEERGHDPDRQRLLEELPGDRNVVGPANMRDEQFGDFCRRHGDSSRQKVGRELNGPHQGVAALVLSQFRHLHHAVP